MIRDTAIARTIDSTELEWMTRFLQPEPWVDKALCAQVGGDAWFAEDHAITATRKAVETCGRCPVAEACLAYALKNNEKHGIWAGTSPNQRARMIKAADA